MKFLRLFPLIIGLLILLSVSYKFFFYNLLPMPLDLLISQYSPWRFESFFGYVPGTYPSKLQYFDTLRQMMPWKYFAVESMRDGILPLWNPYNFSGTPLLANSQSGVLYPLNILFYLFGFKSGWAFYIFAQSVLTYFFTYLFLRKVNIQMIPAVFGSSVFTFSLFLSTFYEYGVFGHTILWLPFLLFCVEELFEQKKIYILLFPIAIAACFFAGHLQLFGFVFVTVLLYVFYKTWLLKDWKKVQFFLPLLAAGLLISAIGLIPVLDLIGKSARSTHDLAYIVTEFLFKPSNLMLFIAPDFYGNPVTRNFALSGSYPSKALYIGMAPLVFALFSLFFVWKEKVFRFFIVLSLFILLLIVDTPLSRAFYSLQIPLVSTGSPLHMIFLVSFSLSVLSAKGMQNFIERKEAKKLLLITASIFLLIIVNMTLIISSASDRNLNSLIIASALLVGFSFLALLSSILKKFRIPLLLLIILLTLSDGYYFFQKFNPYEARELLFPKTNVISFIKANTEIERSWGFGQGIIEGNFHTYFEIHSPEGYDPLYLKDYGSFVYSSEDGKLLTEFTSKNRSDAVIYSSSFDGGLAQNPHRAKVLDALGVKYILDRVENGSSENEFPKEVFELVYSEEGWKIYENKNAAARYFLTNSYFSYSGTEAFQDIFFNDSFDPASSILLRETVNSIDEGGENDVVGGVVLEEYMPNYLQFKTSSDREAFLFISDSYDDGWEAVIDNRNEAEVLKANYTFRAVLVPEGEHTVEFIYRPISYEIGKVLTILGLLMMIIIFFTFKKWGISTKAEGK